MKRKRASKHPVMTKKRRLIRFFAITVVLVYLFLFTCHVLIDLFENQIAGYAAKRLETQSNGLYSIKFDFVDLNLFRRSIRFKNLSITPALKSPGKPYGAPVETLVSLEFPVLSAEGISIPDLMIGNGIRITHVSGTHGKVAIITKKPPDEKKDKKRKPLIPIYINDLEMTKTSFEFNDLSKPRVTAVPLFSVAGASLLVSKLKIQWPVIAFGSGEAVLEKPVFAPRDGFYKLTAKKVNLSRAKSSISVDTLELVPQYEKYRFSRVKGYRTNRLSLKIDRVMLDKLDFDEFLLNRRLLCGLMTIIKPDLDIFRDKHIPKRTIKKMKKFPRRLLREMKFKIKIDNVKIANGSLAYTVRGDESKREGKIFFNALRAVIKNLSNFPRSSKGEKDLLMTVSTRVMGKGILSANLSLPPGGKGKSGSFMLSGSLGRMDMGVFNPMLEPNAFIRIECGMVDKLDFHIGADEDRAEGEMKFLYQNLRISLLKRSTEYRKRRFLSFLANSVIFTHNPKPGRSPRVGRIFYRRDEPVSFLNYVWKSLLSGFKSSVGLGPAARASS